MTLRFALGTLALAAVSAQAQVININQAKAMAGGVTPGDEPGFPVTISQPGSYKLTGSLGVAGNMQAILIEAPNVTLDLNGFTVSGPRCGPQRCSIGVGGSPGINVKAPGAVIGNGRVDAFNSTGIYADPYVGSVTLERLSSTRHAEWGAILRQGAQVLGSRFEGNVGGGLIAESGLVGGSLFKGEGVWLLQVAPLPGVLVERSSFQGPRLWSGATSAGSNLCNGQLC